MMGDCAKCALSVPAPQRGEGTFDCRRYPPVSGRFAETHAGLWCGEYRPGLPRAEARSDTPRAISPTADPAGGEGAKTAPQKKQRGGAQTKGRPK